VYWNPALVELAGTTRDELQALGTRHGIHPDDRDATERYVERVHDSFASGSWSGRLVRPDGQVVHVRTSSAPIIGDDGSVIGRVGSVVDITADITAERRRQAFLYSPVAQFRLDPDTGVREVNDALTDLLARPADDLVGRRALDLTEAGDVDAVRAHLDDLLAGRAGSDRFTWRFLDGHGVAIPCDVTATVLRDDDGEPNEIHAQLDGRSHRQRVEDGRRWAEQWLVRSFESSPVPQFHEGDDGRIVLANRAMADFVGCEPEQLRGRPAVEVLLDLDGAAGAPAASGGRPTPRPCWCRRADGSLRPVTASRRPVTSQHGEPLGWVVHLLQRPAEPPGADDDTALAVALLDEWGVVLDASPGCEALLEQPSGSLVGGAAVDHVAPEDHQVVEEFFRRALRRPGERLAARVRARTRTGHTVWRDVVLCNRLDDPSVGGVVLAMEAVGPEHPRRTLSAVSEQTAGGREPTGAPAPRPPAVTGPLGLRERRLVDLLLETGSPMRAAARAGLGVDEYLREIRLLAPRLGVVGLGRLAARFAEPPPGDGSAPDGRSAPGGGSAPGEAPGDARGEAPGDADR
jgi:PAS domain S-box-containing protein